MDTRLCEDVKQMVEKEIDTIVNKEEMTPDDLENLGELVDILKDLHEMDDTQSQGMSGRSYGIMPYYGYIGYDEPYGRSGAKGGRTSNNGTSPNGGSSYGNYAQGRPNRMNYNDGLSYGYDDMRMMPRGSEW